jgi:UDP-glucuronate 4-epimerase
MEQLQNMKILVTGAAGFIGFHASRAFLERGDTVLGLDNLNSYYDPSLKKARLEQLQAYQRFRFVQLDLTDSEGMAELFLKEGFHRVIHLAAQAGVRHSITDPHSYVDSNVTGTLNVLEGCRYNNVEHLVFASTSSIYGNHRDMPFSEHRPTDHPLAIYPATKKATEHMAHSYAHLFGLPCTGLRFFTVYGPWGRPDMALFLFTKNILAGEPIDFFNYGNHSRDFTYVEDIVDGIIRVCDRIPGPDPEWDPKQPDSATSNVPWRIYNIGSDQPVHLMHFVEVLERELGLTAEKNYHPLQPGDVPETHSDISSLARDTGYQPQFSVEEGVRQFVKWYKWYYSI